MTPNQFTARLERLFLPIDSWGRFRPGARRAAVAFILYLEGGRWAIPFVRRRADLRDHPGQVALPGGSVETGEGAWEAAEREVMEEIAVPVGRLRPLGAGETIYTSISNFCVVPFIAYLPEPVEPFVHAEAELDGVISIPLERLLDDAAWSLSAEPWRFRHLAHEESVVWGLTERIVAGLAPRLREALAGDRTPGPPAAPA